MNTIPIQIKPNKNKSGSVSLSSLICLNILVIIIISSMLAYQNLMRYEKSSRSLAQNDYEAKIGPVCAEINYLYSIKNAYESTNSAAEFERYFATMDRLGHRRVYKKEYYNDERVTIKSIAENSRVNIDNTSIEFSIACIFKDELDPRHVPGKYFTSKKDYIQRYISKRCQIINPYLKYNIKTPEEKRNLTYEEIKTLFSYK